MKIAVLADVHADLPALEAVLAEIRRQECDTLFHAGDLITMGPYPAECVDLALAEGLRCVAGNHEQWIHKGLPTDPLPVMDDEELMHQHWTHSRLDKHRRDFIRTFPTRIDEELDGVRLSVVHFAPSNTRGPSGPHRPVTPQSSETDILAHFNGLEADLICFGHLHERPMSRTFRGRHLLNPGSAGCSRSGRARYATVEIHAGRFSVTLQSISYDRSALLRRYDELEVPARAFIRRHFLGQSQGT